MLSKYFPPSGGTSSLFPASVASIQTSLFRWSCVFFFQFVLLFSSYGQNDEVKPSWQLPASGSVVFIGNSLIEEAGKYGILEWLFLNTWPEQNPRFRNLGWSGDTADGKARSYISRPPEPYDLLLQQIDTLRPDLVVIGYGNVEAYQEEAGLDDFEKSLERLIHDIDQMGAQSVLLSTIPQFSPMDLDVDMSRRNEHLAHYSEKIREVAQRNQKPFVDLFSGFMESGRTYYHTEGIHLNGKGYLEVGKQILKVLGQLLPVWHLEVDARQQNVVPADGMEVSDQNISRTHVSLEISTKANPVLVNKENVYPQWLKVQGLKKGIYGLTIDGQHILAASSSDFADGVEINQGPSFDLARTIQDIYAEIFDLYFWQYRPLNRTYLVGFRRYEQGQNTYELGINSLFIDRLEKKIEQMDLQTPRSIQLTRINK